MLPLKAMFLENGSNRGRTRGWIEVICGSMFSGKTEELIRRLRRAEFANQEICLFKPEIDLRFSKDKVVSHQGNSLEARIINNSREITALWNKEKIVAIDEAQFFDAELPKVCNELAGNAFQVTS